MASSSNISTKSNIDSIKLRAEALSEGIRDAPVCIIVLGMAGSGKTDFTRQLVEESRSRYNPYVVNMDPACRDPPYGAYIDIRDTVKYKEVMKQYELGPNGAIVTSLNLFTTQMTKFVDTVRRAGERGHKWCIIDTPGQIEVFTWSASGNIFIEGLATMFPTIIVYVIDVVRSICPTTFMANMLYGCSILYKSHLPFLVALNKIDLQDCTFVQEWMTDISKFLDALDKEHTFVNNLNRRMALTLDTFYENLTSCGVSSKTGEGFSTLIDHLLDCTTEYEREFKPVYEKLRKERLNKLKEIPQLAPDIKDDGRCLFPSLVDKDPTTIPENKGFLMAPSLVPIEEGDDHEMETDNSKTINEERTFLNFIQGHLNS